MKEPGLVSTLGVVTGGLYMLTGFALLFSGPLLTAPADSMLQSTARGLRTSADAIRSVTEGVSNSTGMVEQVTISLETSSDALSGTADVIRQTVELLEASRIVLPTIANDISSIPVMLRNLMPNNHFDEVAERTQTVAMKLGELNSTLESLSSDVSTTSDAIAGVAVSVEGLQEDLLSAEGSFSEAAEKMERAAVFIENGSFSTGIVVFALFLGILLVLTGLYQMASGLMIKRMSKEKASE